MGFSFDDIKQIYVNNFRETRGIMLAEDYASFVDKVLTVITDTLNTTSEGRDLTDQALGIALRNNATPEEWQKTKVNILTFLFWLTMNECPQLKHEMALHLYRELRKENPT